LAPLLVACEPVGHRLKAEASAATSSPPCGATRTSRPAESGGVVSLERAVMRRLTSGAEQGEYAGDGRGDDEVT
jgi:hypothetical protein